MCVDHVTMCVDHVTMCVDHVTVCGSCDQVHVQYMYMQVISTITQQNGMTSPLKWNGGHIGSRTMLRSR